MPVRRRKIRVMAVLLSGLALASVTRVGQAQAAQPSNWGSTGAGAGGAYALSTSSLKAATVGALTQSWTATLAPVTVTDCLGNPSSTYDGYMVAAGSTLVRHQGPVVRAYAVATGAVLWTTDTRKNTADPAAYWRVTMTPDRVYVYQASCSATSRMSMVTALDSRTGAVVARRSGLGSGSIGEFGVISGSIVLPGRVIDATTLADRWLVPAPSGYRAAFGVASSTIALFQVGGDVLRTIEARRLWDGVLLWSKTNTGEQPVGFASDDSTLYTQNGGQLIASDPATGALKWRSANSYFFSASPSDVLVVSSNATGGNQVDRISADGVKTASTNATPSALRTAIAGKLVLKSDYGYSKGLQVLLAGTLAKVTTLVPELKVYEAIPVGSRIALTTINPVGLPSNTLIMMAPPG